jgi:hypothetical protein
LAFQGGEKKKKLEKNKDNKKRRYLFLYNNYIPPTFATDLALGYLVLRLISIYTR